jgi:hypothetical protein
MRWAGHVAGIGEKRNAYKILVENPEGKRLLGRPRRSGGKYLMNLREIKWYGMNWIGVARYRDQWRALVNTVMNLRVPLNAEKFLSDFTIGGFSQRPQLRE